MEKSWPPTFNVKLLLTIKPIAIAAIIIITTQIIIVLFFLDCFPSSPEIFTPQENF